MLGINVEIIEDSINYENERVTTFELEYPRYIHAELMTHRVFSRNAASSRAIPIKKVIDLVKGRTVMPLWTANQAGMQGDIITDGAQIHTLNEIWLSACRNAIAHAEKLSDAGAHKQNVNRILEPFQLIKTIVTATELKNWFNLRADGEAQGEIRILAEKMEYEMFKSEPKFLKIGEWHLPYATAEDRANLTLEECQMISASCCAQVSYRVNDSSIDKAVDIFNKLVGSAKLHASPFEHVCTPTDNLDEWRNLRGYKQMRLDIEKQRTRNMFDVKLNG